MRPDQQRVQTLLTDTVTLLCKNGLQYNKALKVQGLLGITLDDEDVFIVHINKIFDEVRGKVSSISAESNADQTTNNINSITSLNSYGQFENVDGLSFDEEESIEPIPNGMQLPVIHAQQTSILSRGIAVAKKTTNRGTKRPVGAAKRKESRSVKQRLAASFTPEDQEIHHIQMNKDTGYLPEYQEIRVKDEPPDQLIITENNEIHVDDNLPKLENISQTSTYNSTSSRDSYTNPGQNTMVTFESLEDCDESSPILKKDQDTEGEDAMDMIECLLYKEGIDKSEEHKKSASGMYSKVHISGAEGVESPLDGSMVGADDTLASCSGWEESQEATQVHLHVGKSTKSKYGMTLKGPEELKFDPSLSVKSEKVDLVCDKNDSDLSQSLWSDQTNLNEELNAQYKAHLQVSAELGAGFPCGECKLILKTRKVWMEHMKGVHRNRTYSCEVCRKVFRWRSARNRHVVNIHHKRAAPSTDASLESETNAERQTNVSKENRRPSLDIQHPKCRVKCQSDTQETRNISSITNIASNSVTMMPNKSQATLTQRTSRVKLVTAKSDLATSPVKTIHENPMIMSEVTPSGVKVTHVGVKVNMSGVKVTPMGVKVTHSGVNVKSSTPSSKKVKTPKVATPIIKVISPLGDTGNLDYPCGRCMLVFSTSNELAAHHRRAHLHRNFLCPYCDTHFSWRSAKYRHVKKFHRNKLSPSAKSVSGVVSSSAPVYRSGHNIRVLTPHLQGVLQEQQQENRIPGSSLLGGTREFTETEITDEFIITPSGGSTE